MKKYLSLIAIFAVAAIACNKVDESQVLEPENEAVAGTNLVSFSVNLPDFVNADTKASISNAGAFSWETGDAIYVLCCKEENNTFHQVPFAYNTANGNFECSFPAEVTYPGGTGTITISGITRVATPEEANADGRPLAVYPDPRSLENEYRYSDAQKFIKMEGSLNSTTGAIDFVHKSALVNIHIANVPSFASYFTVSGGDAPVKVNFDGETPAEVNKTVPITPKGSASDIVITLYDSADNVIISKKKTGKTLEAGNLYDTPQIAVGPVVLIKNNTLAEATSGGHASSGMPGNIDYYTYSGNFNDNNLKTISILGTEYVYYVYPAEQYGTTAQVIIHHDDFEYPRVETAVKLDNYEQKYNFGYTTGLRREGNNGYTFYVYSQDRTNVDLYAWEPSELFGKWGTPDLSLKGCIKTGGDDSANWIYYFDLTGVSQYSFKLHNGDTSYCDDQNDITVNGNVYWAVYSNSGGTWNYAEDSFNDAGLASWIYKW